MEPFIRSLDVRDSSKNAYRRALERFIGWISLEGIPTPLREDIVRYRGFLQALGLSPSTVSLYMAALRRLFEWTSDEGLYPNVAAGVRGAKRARGIRRDPLTAGQVRVLLESIDRGSLQGLRDYAMINLMVRTGVRAIEVSRANVEDIRRQDGEAVLWVRGKGRDSADEFVVLTEKTLPPLRRYLEARGAKEGKAPLFASVSDRTSGERLKPRSIRWVVKRRLREAGLDSNTLSTHSLRHTAITLSLIGGASLQEAQALGRHSNINTTLIYAHNLSRVADAPERRVDAVLGEEQGGAPVDPRDKEKG
jgi:site-specific recombinase XerD